MAKPSDSRWNSAWLEAVELNYFPLNRAGFGPRQKKRLFFPNAGPSKHGSCCSDRGEAKREQASGLYNYRAAPVKPACWARRSAEVNTHERQYWPGLVHKLPREGLRHSRRFLRLTRPVLQQPCPSEEQEAKYLKRQQNLSLTAIKFLP